MCVWIKKKKFFYVLLISNITCLTQQAACESKAVKQRNTENPFKIKEGTEQLRCDPEEENWDEEEDREEDLEVVQEEEEEVSRREQLSDEELTELMEVEEVRVCCVTEIH